MAGINMTPSNLTLFPDQMDIIAGARSAFSRNQSIVICAPTGFGKSYVSAYMAQGVQNKGGKAVFIVHRQELAYQLKETFDECGIPNGLICQGEKFEPLKTIQIAMIGSLKDRLSEILPNLVVCDEAHHAIAKTWKRAIDSSKEMGAKICGLTATPLRLSGEGLKDCFSEIVLGPSTAQLIKMGRLSEYELYAPEILPDMSGAKISCGDYKVQDIEKIINKQVITGNAVEQYKNLCDGKPALVFCSTVQHAKDVAEQFNKSGYRFIALDGNTPTKERHSANEKLRSGEIHGITNCSIYTEGVSVDRVECVILLRPTKSLTIYLQSIGRGLRKFKGKEKLVVIDSVGACFIHGLPCDDRVWSLESKKKKRSVDEKPIALRHCKGCKAVYAAKHQVCPRCGATQEIEHRDIKTQKGELKKITKDDILAIAEARRKRKREEWEAQTYDELVALGEKRGYANPKYWAKFKLEFRGKRNGKSKAG